MDARVKSIIRYVIPAVSSMVVSFAYGVVDGMFVGRGVGVDALAAVNIALPFNVLVLAVASLLTMGGATVFAIRAARGDKEGANDAFVTSGMLVLAASLALSAVGVFLPESIAATSGASAALLESTATYIRYFCLFTMAVTLSMCLSVFVRNDGRPGLAFWGMIAGALANVFLDWLFVFPLQMGLKGAAIASGLGQILSLGILVTHFIGNKGILRIRMIKPSLPLIRKIITRGTPELITQLYHPLTVLCYNLVIIRTMGEAGIAAFSVVTYISALFVGVFSGVSQGIQPLLGKSYGRGEAGELSFYLKAGLLINAALSTTLYIAMLVGGKWIYAFFTTDADLIRAAETIWKHNALAFIFASANIVFTTYFFSIKQTSNAIVTAGCRGLLFNTIAIFTFPSLFGAENVWFAIVASEVLVLGLALHIKNRSRLRIESLGDLDPVPVVLTRHSSRFIR